MAAISATSENEIKAFLASWWTAVNQQIAAVTGNGVPADQDAPLEVLLASDIGQCLVRIAEAAEDQRPWSPENSQAVRSDCEAFEAWLNQGQFTHSTPDEFWNTPIGHMFLKARLWADQDQLISLKEAAELSGLSLSSLSQRISRGQMKFYRDPHEPNPQHGRRIRMTDLDQFIREGILRKPGTTIYSRFSIPYQALSQSHFQNRPASKSEEPNQP